MLSLFVYLFFFILLFIILFYDTELGFFALLLGILFFPPSVVVLMKSPYLDPKSIYLYAFFIIEIAKHSERLRDDIKTFPLKIPFVILGSSYICTALLAPDGSLRQLYNALRIFIDTYGFFLAAYIVGRHCDVNNILKLLFIPVLILCGFGIVEFAIGDNYPYKVICSAFPFYTGFVDLNTTINFSQDWRSRICILTKHPTTLGTLMSILFLSYLPYHNTEYLKQTKTYFLLASIFLILILCGSRTALLCTILFTILYLVLKRSLTFRIIFVIAITFGITFYSVKFIDRINVKGQGSSLELRTDQLLYSYAQFLNSPYFGNGLSYIEKNLVEEDKNGKKQVENLGGLESVVFTLIINQGLYGFIAYFLMMGWIFVYFYRRRNQREFATQGYLITGAVSLFFIISGHIGSNDIMSYIFIGLFLGNSNSEENEEAEVNSQQETPSISSAASLPS